MILFLLLQVIDKSDTPKYVGNRYTDEFFFKHRFGPMLVPFRCVLIEFKFHLQNSILNSKVISFLLFQVIDKSDTRKYVGNRYTDEFFFFFKHFFRPTLVPFYCVWIRTKTWAIRWRSPAWEARLWTSSCTRWFRTRLDSKPSLDTRKRSYFPVSFERLDRR